MSWILIEKKTLNETFLVNSRTDLKPKTPNEITDQRPIKFSKRRRSKEGIRLNECQNKRVINIKFKMEETENYEDD